MKKYIYTLLIVTLLYSCGGDGEDSPESTPVEVNQAPSVPNLMSPTNNQLCYDNKVEFTWDKSEDPENEIIKYELIIARDSEFKEINNRQTSSTNKTTITLKKGIHYFWKVRALDLRKNTSKYSPTFTFFTESEGIKNHAPSIPTEIEPLNNSYTGNRPFFQWFSSDIDGDTLTYDVYFDDEFPPTTKVIESYGSQPHEFNSSSITTSLINNNNDLKPNTKYYWRIVAKDGKGAESIGKTWSFTTVEF